MHLEQRHLYRAISPDQKGVPGSLRTGMKDIKKEGGSMSGSEDGTSVTHLKRLAMRQAKAISTRKNKRAAIRTLLSHLRNILQ